MAPRPDDPDHAVRGEPLPLYRPQLPRRVPGLHGDQAPGARGLRLGRDATGERPPARRAPRLAAGLAVPAVLLRRALRRPRQRQRLPGDLALPGVSDVSAVRPHERADAAGPRPRAPRHGPEPPDRLSVRAAPDDPLQRPARRRPVRDELLRHDPGAGHSAGLRLRRAGDRALAALALDHCRPAPGARAVPDIVARRIPRPARRRRGVPLSAPRPGRRRRRDGDHAPRSHHRSDGPRLEDVDGVRDRDGGARRARGVEQGAHGAVLRGPAYDRGQPDLRSGAAQLQVAEHALHGSGAG